MSKEKAHNFIIRYAIVWGLNKQLQTVWSQSGIINIFILTTSLSPQQSNIHFAMVHHHTDISPDQIFFSHHSLSNQKHMVILAPFSGIFYHALSSCKTVNCAMLVLQKPLTDEQEAIIVQPIKMHLSCYQTTRKML